VEQLDINAQKNLGELGLLAAYEDGVSELLLTQMGMSGRAFRREHRAASSRIVSEVYSAPRLVKERGALRKAGLLPGFSLDITTLDPETGQPWDFNCAATRSKARGLLRAQRPLFLVGSPMCKAFSTWQALNNAKYARDPALVERERLRALVHLHFVMELYQEQLDAGRYFLHEHPLAATSWQVAKVRLLLSNPSVGLVHGDQCQYGQEALDGKYRGCPVKKPSGFMSNSPEVLKVLSRRCLGQGGACSRPNGGWHAHAEGRIAANAAYYPRALCRAMIHGMGKQLRRDGLLVAGCYGLMAPVDEDKVALHGPAEGYSGRYHDDHTGQTLRDDLVIEARRKELG